MEKPYAGRATIQDNITETVITIPAPRNGFVIGFLCFWLCGWFLGETFALGALIGVFNHSPVSIFLLVWLTMWTFGGVMVVRTIYWMLKGREVITIGQGRLTVEKKAMLFAKPKTYDLNEVKQLRVLEDAVPQNVFGRRRTDFGGFSSNGLIRFDYGLKTIRMAAGIDEAEARYIVEQLKTRRLLTERNFSGPTVTI